MNQRAGAFLLTMPGLGKPLRPGPKVSRLACAALYLWQTMSQAHPARTAPGDFRQPAT